MREKKILSSLLFALESQGCRGRAVSTDCISELRDAVEMSHHKGLFDEEFYLRELTHFQFNGTGSLKKKKSLIVIAVPQPHVRVLFHHGGRKFPCLIPSNYSHKTDDKVKDILESVLQPLGYRLEMARLPLKTLAARSGLGRYGRNNLVYIEGLGSYHRLVAFYSDFSVLKNNWSEPRILDECKGCTACQRVCPTGAIPSARFLLQAERCLSYFSEHQGEFPEWIDPTWHHCLVGCLLCQRTCPVNKKVKMRTVNGPSFKQEETELFLSGTPEKELPRDTVDKLEQLSIIEYSSVLGRNLKALISI